MKTRVGGEEECEVGEGQKDADTAAALEQKADINKYYSATT